MPKRLDAAMAALALAAGSPPESSKYASDKRWHAAQDQWIAVWSNKRLPPPNDKTRRRQWTKRKEEHARLVKTVMVPAQSQKRERETLLSETGSGSKHHKAEPHVAQHGFGTSLSLDELFNEQSVDEPARCDALKECTMGRGYRLMEGNCHNVVPWLPDASVDLVCADVPYGAGNSRFNDSAFKQDQWLVLISELWRVLRPGGHILLLCDYATFKNLSHWLEDARVTDYMLTWQKTNRRSGGGYTVAFQPLRDREYVLVLYRKASHATLRATSKFSHEYSPAGQARDLGDYKVPCPEDSLKPKALYETLLRKYSQAGDTVLDFCMYTGICGVAALEMGRRFVGIEINVDTAGRRMKIFERACAAVAACASEFEPGRGCGRQGELAHS